MSDSIFANMKPPVVLGQTKMEEYKKDLPDESPLESPPPPSLYDFIILNLENARDEATLLNVGSEEFTRVRRYINQAIRDLEKMRYEETLSPTWDKG